MDGFLINKTGAFFSPVSPLVQTVKAGVLCDRPVFLSFRLCWGCGPRKVGAVEDTSGPSSTWLHLIQVSWELRQIVFRTVLADGGGWGGQKVSHASKHVGTSVKVFANSSNKRVILEHLAQVWCLCGFWPVKAQVMGDFGDNSVPVPQSVTCMSGVG